MLGSCFKRVLKDKEAHFTSRADLDITDYLKLESFVLQNKITHIINCAAYTDVDGAERQKELAFLINGCASLVKVSKNYGIKMIHFSTDYVFNGQKEDCYKEEDSLDPINVYGLSKLEGEKTILSNCPGALILRLSWLFGRGKDNFVSKIMSLLQTEEKISVLSNELGRVTYIEDVVDVTCKLLDKTGIFHVANPGAISRYQLAKDILEIAKELKYPISCKEIFPVEEYLTAAKRPKNTVFETKKLEQMGISLRPYKEAIYHYLSERACLITC